MPKRLLVLNQHYPPDTLASGQILAELAEDLAQQYGWEVEAIAGSPLRIAQGENVQIHAGIQNGVKVHRVASYNPQRRTPLRRIAHYAVYALAALWRARKVPQVDVVLVMSTPPILTAALGLWVARRNRAKFVYNIQDLFPDILESRLNKSHTGRLVYKALDAVARSLERRADCIITIGDVLARRIEHNTGIVPQSIPNWSDPDAIVPLGKDTDFARSHGLSDAFVVMYSGNIGLNQDLDTVIDAAGICSATKDIQFVLIGEGESKAHLQNRVQAEGLANVLFLPYQPKTELSQSLSAADVGLVTVSKGVSPYLVPCKIYGVMAAGSAVLASVDPHSEVESIVLQEPACGVVVPPEAAQAMADAIAALHQDRERSRRLGQAGRARLEQNYARSIATAAYHRALMQVLQPASRDAA